MRIMPFLLLVAGVLGASDLERRPVLVELFTSEGCSSCPPADTLLEALDREQPIPGARAIVLSEHVDYWNDGGWADPFSSHSFSLRQESYAARFGLDGPYTPEMVVDGKAQFVGSDRRAAIVAIRKAAEEAKLAIGLTAAGSGIAVHLEPLPPHHGHSAGIFVALAADAASSNVRRGENQGRTLHHVSIAKGLKQVGSVTDRSGFDITLPAPAPGQRLIVFVQDRANGRVWGAAVWPDKPAAAAAPEPSATAP